MNHSMNDSQSSSHGSILRPVVGGLALLVAVIAMGVTSSAQAPIPRLAPAAAPAVAPATAPDQSAPANQAQDDREWLTAYFMVHQGYKLHHMPAIDDTLNKMTPTQLHTLRDMYDQKHSMMMQQQATFNQLNAQKVAQAEAWNQRQQQQLNQLSAEETQAASLEDRQINQMHQEAAANAEAKSLSYPGNYGPYGSPYGYGGGYIHPYFNPLAQ
jgi:hypothetical protein